MTATPKRSVEWKRGILPECFGWPCLVGVYDGRTVRCWRSSPHTTRQQWCYKVDDGSVVIVQGNMGTVKTAASAAVRRAP